MLATKTPELCFSKRRLSDLAIRTRGFLSNVILLLFDGKSQISDADYSPPPCV